MDAPPDIIKDRQQRYNRLLRLITGYYRSKEELRDMDEMKRETLFEIALRFKRSELNKSYVFPRATNEETELLTEEEMALSGRRDILYNLNRQAVVVVNEQGKPKRSTIERMQTELVASDKDRTLKISMRPLLNRLDIRMQKLLLKETAPKTTRQLTERSPTEKSNERLVHLNGTPRKMPIIESNTHKSQKILQPSQPPTFSSNNLRNDRSTPLVPIIHRKIVLSERASPTNQRRLAQRLATEEAANLARVRSSKKIHTEQSNPQTTMPHSMSPPHPVKTKMRIQTKLQLDTNKIDILTSGLTTNLKPKNLFQKQAF